MELAAYSASGHINILYHTSFHPEVPENVPSGFFSPESERIQAVIEYMHRCDADHTLPVRYEIRRNPQTDTDNEVNLFTYQKPWYRLSFPYTDDPTTIESYKNQLLKNLEVVESPPDCKKILDTKPEHLAVFTNPDHKYVPLLMHYVKTGTMLNCFGGDTLPMPTRDCERLFQKSAIVFGSPASITTGTSIRLSIFSTSYKNHSRSAKRQTFSFCWFLEKFAARQRIFCL